MLRKIPDLKVMVFFSLLGSISFGQDDALKADLADKVAEIFETNCGACHRDSDDGGIDYIADLERLVQRKKIRAGDLEKSRVWVRMNDDSDPMPPDGESPRPSAADKELVKQFIMSLGDGPIVKKAVAKKAVVPRTPVSTATVISDVHNYLSSIDEDDRIFQRFFVLNQLHNLPNKVQDKKRGVSDDFLDLVRAATSKTINSLSWAPSIVTPKIVNQSKTVLAIDVRDIEWDRNRKVGRPDMWNILVQEYPYGLKHDQYPDVASSQRKARDIYEWTGIDFPWVRADWFVATATQPHNYHAIVFDTVMENVRRRKPKKVKHADGKSRLEQPMNEDDLYKLLNVDVKGNLRRGRAARAAFTRSGVSSQPRMLERHPALFGYIWDSYDFLKNNPTSNLNAHPLGPDGTFNQERFGRYSFKHDGGEMIFGMPNGLHGYFLVDGKGDRIPFGPPDVVEDRAKTLGNAIIVNGLSCIACHKNGLITDFDDEIRFGIKGLQSEARKVARKIFLDRPELDVLIEKDQTRYRPAAIQAISPFLRPEKIALMKEGGVLTEPVGPVAKRFLVDTINSVQLAAELEVSEESLKAAVEFNEGLQRVGLSVVVEGGTTNREIWEQGAGLSTFQKAAQILKVGTPTSLSAPPWRGR